MEQFDRKTIPHSATQNLQQGNINHTGRTHSQVSLHTHYRPHMLTLFGCSLSNCLLYPFNTSPHPYPSKGERTRGPYNLTLLRLYPAGRERCPAYRSLSLTAGSHTPCVSISQLTRCLRLFFAFIPCGIMVFPS